MKRYIKPECDIIKMDTTNSLLAGSDPESHNETGNGVWHAPQRWDSYGNYEDDEEDL